MTDTLPRTIPTDPAEQEAQMPEWVKLEVCRLWSELAPSRDLYHPGGVKPELGSLGIFAHALTIWQWMPEPVDPDEAIADEIYAEWLRRNYTGVRDVILSTIKRVREAGK